MLHVLLRWWHRYKERKTACTLVQWEMTTDMKIGSIGRRAGYKQIVDTFQFGPLVSQHEHGVKALRVSSLHALAKLAGKEPLESGAVDTIVEEATRAERLSFSTHMASLQPSRKKRKVFFPFPFACIVELSL